MRRRGKAFKRMGPRTVVTPRSLARREEALGPHPKAGGSHNSVGCEFFGAGMYAQASLEFAKAVRLNPWKAIFKANLARAYACDGRGDEAMEMMAAALRQAPDSADVLFAAGVIAEARKEPKAAILFYRRCLAAKPHILIERDARENLEVLLREEKIG